jgi:hypothetical protein
MGVTFRHKAYTEAFPKWQRARDCYEGSDAVKARGTQYLPAIEGDKGKPGRYEEYLQRALFYNATGRTVEGLAGAIFQKAPVFDVPGRLKGHVADVTLSGVSGELFALHVTRDVLTTGRVGILVDMADGAGQDMRPYWVQYRAEDIVNWRTERRGGDEILTRVVLHEEVEEPDPKDEFGMNCVDQYRVLNLTPAGYTQTAYRKRVDSTDEWIPYILPGQTDAVLIPCRRGVPLDFIPFVFIGPTSTSCAIEKEPLRDLIIVNLSIYQTAASLENGLYHVGVPVLVLIGAANDGTPVNYGPRNSVILPLGGDAKILQVDSEKFGALERADERKRKNMATLGAKLLEDQPRSAETATAVGMRHSGEHATLRTIAQAVEQGLTIAIRFHVWWMGLEATPEIVEAGCELNKEFFAVKMSEAELRAHVMAWQADGMSWETLHYNLTRGDVMRPGVTAEEERQAIESEAPPAPEPPEPDPNAPPMPPGGRPPMPMPGTGGA